MTNPVAEIHILVEVTYDRFLGRDTVSYRIESMTRPKHMSGVLGAGSHDNVKERLLDTFGEELTNVLRRLKQQSKRRRA